MNQIW